MEFRFCCCWTSLWVIVFLLTDVSADPSSSPQYVLHQTGTAFDQAGQDCSPGVLTTVATEQEVGEILELVSNSVPLQDEFTFWVGLKKAKNECVVPALPLRGFRWIEDGSQTSQVSRWMEEPQRTCTAVRCAALKGQFDGSTVTGWGLIPVSCKHLYQFICKLTGRSPEGRTSTIKPATPEPQPGPQPATPEPQPQPEPATPEPEPGPEPQPGTPELQPTTPEPSKPASAETRPATSHPEAAPPEPALPTPGPELIKLTEREPETGSGPGSGAAPGSDSCEHPTVPSSRSFSLDPDDRSRIRVECWSTIQLDLFCSGRPTAWRMLDGSPANFSAVCLQCASGFQKDASGHCIDVDECSAGAPCRHTCLNTEGSYRCICVDESGKHHDHDSPLCTDTVTVEDNDSLSGILIPVLIAVSALVVLAAVVAVVVKCCLMRRSKKRAMKKAEKMAMKSKNGKDSFETANEKAAT